MARSLCRFLSPEDALQVQVSLDKGKGGSPLQYIKSVPLGGAYILRKLWEKLGLHRVIVESLKEREYRAPVEWAILNA
ncbi:MAG: hypothetical protein QMD66_05695 [Actinomycetota bacterium]|nr:hypothetical protein [Actinomycetota bacterium]